MDDAIFIEIQRLCRLVHERGLREISISRPDFSLSLTAVSAGTPLTTPVLPAAPASAAAPAPAVPEAIPAPPAGYVVASPLIGVYYRSPSPDSPPFVEVGDTVEVGQTIGIVEAMKVFNEITTERAGKIIATPVDNGTLVQVDEPLVIIEPSE